MISFFPSVTKQRQHKSDFLKSIHCRKMKQSTRAPRSKEILKSLIEITQNIFVENQKC